MPHTNALVHDLRLLLAHNRDGSFNTQGDRRSMLLLCARQLKALGFPQLRARDLGGRHVNRLLQLWHRQAISPETVRNRLAVLRWWASKVGRGHVMPHTNEPYGLAPRQTVATTSKAQTVEPAALEAISDAYLRWSVALQQAFGLRRKECLMIRPWDADQGDHLALRSSMTKGGRARIIPIRTPEQRTLLDTIKAWLPTKTSALIPPHLTYIQQRHRYDRLTREAGLSNLHGLRHHYAQSRLHDETGYPAPVNGGPHRREMSPAQRARDNEARLTVSRELGHGRRSVTSTYVGT